MIFTRKVCNITIHISGKYKLNRSYILFVTVVNFPVNLPNRVTKIQCIISYITLKCKIYFIGRYHKHCFTRIANNVNMFIQILRYTFAFNHLSEKLFRDQALMLRWDKSRIITTHCNNLSQMLSNIQQQYNVKIYSRQS